MAQNKQHTEEVTKLENLIEEKDIEVMKLYHEIEVMRENINDYKKAIDRHLARIGNLEAEIGAYRYMIHDFVVAICDLGGC